MESTGSDFTNTFRVLSEVKTTGLNDDIVNKISELSAPKEFFIKKLKHPHAENPKMVYLLEHKPEVLKLYGMDPD